MQRLSTARKRSIDSGSTWHIDRRDDVLGGRDREVELGIDAEVLADLVEQQVAAAGAAGDAGQFGGYARLLLGDGILDRAAGHSLPVRRKAQLGGVRRVDPVPGEEDDARLLTAPLRLGVDHSRLLLDPVKLGENGGDVVGQNAQVLVQRQLTAHGVEVEVLGTFDGLVVQPHHAPRILRRAARRRVA